MTYAEVGGFGWMLVLLGIAWGLMGVTLLGLAIRDLAREWKKSAK